MAAADRKFKHELELVVKEIDSIHAYFEEKWSMCQDLNPEVCVSAAQCDCAAGSMLVLATPCSAIDQRLPSNSDAW